MTMRNRRTIIVAFVLAACTLIGVGYAAVTGNLTITGATSFQAYGETAGQIHSAVKFSGAQVVETSEGAACSTGISATGNGDYADLTVVFTDTTAATATYYAVVKYTVVYETTSSTLPEVKFDIPSLTENGTACQFTYYLDDSLTNAWDESDSVTLQPAADNSSYNTFDFYVKVTYTETGSEVGKVEATPSISLNYSGGTDELNNGN